MTILYWMAIQYQKMILYTNKKGFIRLISENYKSVLKNVNDITKKSDRNINDVVLIAVSKTKPIDALKEAYNAGAREFGENKVQELVDKYDQMPSDVKWHLIGHLQTNKVKYIIGKVSLIHSVDSYKLAEVISKESLKHNVVTNILIEVNVADEESKFGVKVDECEDLVRKISELPNVSIKGLMTVAPFVDDAEDNRPVFRKLSELSVDIKRKNIDNVNMECLSMGMSGDYNVAIEEGATYVRVGTSIFGERNYNI